MSMFRVYLRRRGSSNISWQYATTVATANATAAAQTAFDQWAAEANSTAPNSLADCDQMVNAT